MKLFSFKKKLHIKSVDELVWDKIAELPLSAFTVNLYHEITFYLSGNTCQMNEGTDGGPDLDERWAYVKIDGKKLHFSERTLYCTVVPFIREIRKFHEDQVENKRIEELKAIIGK